VVFERQPGDLTGTANLIILKIGPKESPFGSGYTTQVRGCAMPKAVHATSGLTATAFAKRFHPNHPPDIISEKPACDSGPRCHETRTELAHANRVAILGQLSASIAHEVNQPIVAMVISAQAALRWLGRQPPDLEEARQALAQIVQDATRAGDIVDRICALIKKAPSRKERLDINQAIREVIELTRSEAVKNCISVQTKLAKKLPLIQADQVQLQQVMLNLIINAVEAMSPHAAGARDLLIRTAKTRSGGVRVIVRDSGPGVDPANLERIFDAYFTTKADGLGMGLSICRAIIQAHGGRLSATRGAAQGTIVQLTLPGGSDSAP
jgi:C4-dicarboxylate-specific signal transduction histidine kinase